MILTDSEAIEAGFANLASYRHHCRIAAIHEAEHDAASRQAELMAQRRTAQQAGGGGSSACYVPAVPRLGAE